LVYVNASRQGRTIEIVVKNRASARMTRQNVTPGQPGRREAGFSPDFATMRP
jgi:hypothetical protein